jgi:predicted Zn-dependent protease
MATRITARAVLAGLLPVLLACGTLPVDEEKKIGHQVQRQVRERFQLMRDRVVVNYVRQLGADLVESAHPSPFEIRLYVVEDEEINAFAIPGGAIYVHTGVLLQAKDASEVAGVIAHEIGHVTARHFAQSYNRQRNTGVGAQVATIAIAILTGNPYITNAGGLVTDIAASSYLHTYTREHERESDQLAVETLVRAGFDPQGMVDFFETMQKEAEGGFRLPQFLSSHPATEERLANVKGMIQARQPLPPVRRDDGGKLEIIQERIRLIAGTDADYE